MQNMGDNSVKGKEEEARLGPPDLGADLEETAPLADSHSAQEWLGLLLWHWPTATLQELES